LQLRIPAEGSVASPSSFNISGKGEGEENINWFEVLNSWDGSSQDENFDKYAMLCPSVIRCVDVQARKAYLVEISKSINDVTWNTDLFDHQLIISPSKKSLLKKLVENRLKEGYKTMGDFISNKGKGLIVVLHGPPGTGKTFVAESLAEYVKRPLMALSIGDLITDHRKLEYNLDVIFTQCKEWHSLLLLDEADVVLEARSIEDVRRNAIVSSKWVPNI
jgi:SpoVK/Ycf46/Vps4 family AAA+-type ATPase